MTSAMYVICDVTPAFGRRRWLVAWTPFGPVLLLDPEAGTVSLPDFGATA